MTTIIEQLLPVAREGLDAIGISREEASRYLGVIEQRLTQQQTGAIWQQKKLAALRKDLPLDEALHQLLEAFISRSELNIPVAKWSL